MQGRFPSIICYSNRCAKHDQAPHSTQFAEGGCEDQGCLATNSHLAVVGAELDQALHHFYVAATGCSGQGCLSITFRMIDVSSELSHEDVDNFDAIKLSGLAVMTRTPFRAKCLNFPQSPARDALSTIFSMTTTVTEKELEAL
jgi:hypothetical protein